MDICSVLSTLVSTIVGAAVGAIVTWKVAKHYYVEAGKELKSEADKLRSLTKFLGYKLNEKGIIDLPKDENEILLITRVFHHDVSLLAKP
jgi:hypothetical protein